MKKPKFKMESWKRIDLSRSVMVRIEFINVSQAPFILGHLRTCWKKIASGKTSSYKGKERSISPLVISALGMAKIEESKDYFQPIYTGKSVVFRRR